jgi:preprotein translocase subunit SecF
MLPEDSAVTSTDDSPQGCHQQTLKQMTAHRAVFRNMRITAPWAVICLRLLMTAWWVLFFVKVFVIQISGSTTSTTATTTTTTQQQHIQQQHNTTTTQHNNTQQQNNNAKVRTQQQHNRLKMQPFGTNSKPSLWRSPQYNHQCMLE